MGKALDTFPLDNEELRWGGEEDSGQPACCDLCGRQVGELTRHHLIPRSRHSKNRIKKEFSRQEMRGRVAHICRDCHNQIHRTYSEKDLADRLNTLETLKAAPEMERFLVWVKKQRVGV